MRGRYDLDSLDTWSTVCYNLVHSAARFKNPEHLMDEFYKFENKEFFTQIFGAHFANELFKIPDWKDLLEEGVLTTLQVAYRHDWDAWSRRMETSRVKYENQKPQLNRQMIDNNNIRPRRDAQWHVNNLLNPQVVIVDNLDLDR